MIALGNVLNVSCMENNQQSSRDVAKFAPKHDEENQRQLQQFQLTKLDDCLTTFPRRRLEHRLIGSNSPVTVLIVKLEKNGSWAKKSFTYH